MNMNVFNIVPKLKRNLDVEGNKGHYERLTLNRI